MCLFLVRLLEDVYKRYVGILMLIDMRFLIKVLVLSRYKVLILWECVDSDLDFFLKIIYMFIIYDYLMLF